MSILKFKADVFSQNGEDGIIQEALKRIKPKSKACVEMGGADGYYCSNTANLRDNKKWQSFMYDLNEVPGLVEKKMITTANINDIPECSVLSIDVDSIDHELWNAYQGTPAIVIIEINSSLPPLEDFYSPEKGCNFSLMNKLAESKGYFLLCHTGNMIFVLNKYKELFPDRSESFDTSWL